MGRCARGTEVKERAVAVILAGAGSWVSLGRVRQATFAGGRADLWRLKPMGGKRSCWMRTSNGRSLPNQT